MVTVEAKSIIWDLDGTLIDSFGIYTEVLAEILPQYGWPMPPEQTLIENYHGSLTDTISNVLGGVEPDELESIIQDFLQAQNGHYEIIDHHFYPDALEFAKRAHSKGLFQAIVTNRNHMGRLNASPLSIVERSVLKDLIDTVVCGDDTEHRKPSAAVVDTLLAEGKIIPEETVVIGDQYVDAELARNLGAKAILVNRGTQPIAHLDRLGKNWQNDVQIVRSLNEVTVLDLF